MRRKRQMGYGGRGGRGIIYNEFLVNKTDGFEWYYYYHAATLPSPHTESDPDGQPDRERSSMHAAEYVPQVLPYQTRISGTLAGTV